MGWLSDLLKDYPALSVAKQRLALAEERYNNLKEENQLLKEQLAPMKTNLRSKANPHCKAIVLAAGKSMRWQASVQDFSEDRYYSSLYWTNINRHLTSIGQALLTHPPEDPGLHKSCALLSFVPLIQYSFLSYLAQGIRDLTVVVSSESPAQEQIGRYIALWNTRNTLSVKPQTIHGDNDIAYSAFRGFKSIDEDYDRDILVSYSDIVWEERLINTLLEQEAGDITILVDSAWRDNYPKRRIWHDELYAELVFGDKHGNIERIGEIVNRYTNIPEWHPNEDRVLKIDRLLEHNCIGEIVGLFKFSPRGRKAFCDKYAEVAASSKPSIPIVKWKEPFVPNPSPLIPIEEDMPLNKCLLGCFLEYLNKTSKLDIKIVLVKGGWAEVDHWGDICLAQERFKYDNPIRLELKGNY